MAARPDAGDRVRPASSRRRAILARLSTERRTAADFPSNHRCLTVAPDCRARQLRPAVAPDRRARPSRPAVVPDRWRRSTRSCHPAPTGPGFSAPLRPSGDLPAPCRAAPTPCQRPADGPLTSAADLPTGPRARGRATPNRPPLQDVWRGPKVTSASKKRRWSTLSGRRNRERATPPREGVTRRCGAAMRQSTP